MTNFTTSMPLPVADTANQSQASLLLSRSTASDSPTPHSWQSLPIDHRWGIIKPNPSIAWNLLSKLGSFPNPVMIGRQGCPQLSHHYTCQPPRRSLSETVVSRWVECGHSSIHLSPHPRNCSTQMSC